MQTQAAVAGPLPISPESGSLPQEIAIVDDDELFLSTLAANLSAHGFRVATFRNPRMALNLLLSMPQLRACLIDWRMPNMDGPTLIDALRRSGFAAPIMVVTSSLHPKTRSEAIAHGAAACIEKTQGFPAMLKRIGALAGGAAACDEGERNSRGPLDIERDTRSVRWRGEKVPLTEPEFQILLLLTDLADSYVGHGELYWAVQHDALPAGGYTEGYRMMVRRIMEGIRQKFLAIDPRFDALDHRTGLGYRWHAGR